MSATFPVTSTTSVDLSTGEEDDTGAFSQAVWTKFAGSLLRDLNASDLSVLGENNGDDEELRGVPSTLLDGFGSSEETLVVIVPNKSVNLSNSVVGRQSVVVGEVLPGNLRGTGSSGGQSFTNATGAITFAQASTTPSMVPAVPAASTPASVGFDAIAGDGANGVAAAVTAVAPGSGSSGSA